MFKLYTLDMEIPFLHHEALNRLIARYFKAEEIEVLERPASFIVKKKQESGDNVVRIIILPPHGYTSNHPNELSSHEEVRRAKIYVKGILKKEKKNFSLLKNCLKYLFLKTRSAVTETAVPYASAIVNSDICAEKIISSKENLYVVKENGEGFYHNLINLTAEWLVLVLDKELRLMKKMDIQSKIAGLSGNEKNIITQIIKETEKYGDGLFRQDAQLVGKAMGIKSDNLLPPLIETLNIYETGRHEPCTIYALILKKAKVDKLQVLKHIRSGIEKHEAPLYYLHELEKKISTM